MNIDQFSIPIWVLKNRIKNEKGNLIEFKDHLFLYQLYRDIAPKQVIKKCAQVGASVMMNLKAFHLARYKNMNIIYTMPSDSDVQEFSKTKTEKIYQNNKIIRESIGLDNVGLKQVGDSFLYFKGTRSAAAPISTTADLLIHDELDRSDLSIIEIYQSRIGTSEYKGEWLLSNPSLTNIGVDIAWKDSDKKEWFVVCPHCEHEQELKWEDNVNEIDGIYVCRECHKKLPDEARRLGQWKPTSEGEFSGYHISQMMATWLTAKDLISVREKRGIEYFNNFVLGEPYSIGESADFRQVITDCTTRDVVDEGPFFMGIDVGKEKHYVVGSRKGIFRIGKCESREELQSVIDRYDPTWVMDSGPERTWAEEFKREYPKGHLCFYRRDKDIAKIVEWGGDKGTYEHAKNRGYVWIDRNRLIDELVYNMTRGEILFNLSREDLERYILHWETMRRVREEVPSLRSERYVWESTTGVNHWASATWFFWIALKRGAKKLEHIKEEKTDKDDRLIEIPMSGGMKMRDLKDVMDEQQLYE